jgi:protein-L-isoaspartate(D-aspartate) O-methyltransferase
MMDEEFEYRAERLRMVDSQIRARGVSDPRVLDAMESVPRHLFVPEGLRRGAYSDEPLPIGDGQTISQPYIVAYMTEALGLEGDERVLEVGTGSGYQAAVLARLAAEVFTVELIEGLAQKAQDILRSLGIGNVRFRVGDGSKGWPEEAPFDGIIVTAAAARVPAALEAQLGPSGTMVIPVGIDYQELLLIRKTKKGLKRQPLLPVRFVPLVSPRGEAGKGRQ